MNTLLERLQTVEKRYEELTQILMDPSIANDIQKMTQASKEQASLEKAYKAYHIGILLNSSGFTEVTELGTFSVNTLTTFHTTVQLAQCDDGDVQFFG